MAPRLKWGLIGGGAAALFNLCGGILLGPANSCVSIMIVAVAAAAAGYFCGRQEPAGKTVRAGAIAGAVVGGINLVAQLTAGIIAGLAGAGALKSLAAQLAPYPEITQNTWIIPGLIIVSAVIGGVIKILAGVGAGALAAWLFTPKTPAPRELNF